MRCSQCGFDALPQAAFCSRCGARLAHPKPESVREYSLTLVRRSYWHYTPGFILGGVLVILGVSLVFRAAASTLPGFILLLCGLVVWGAIPVAHRAVAWRITSDRLIEKRGLLSTIRREVELSDIRSIEVSRRLGQRIIGLGDVLVASSASTDYLIRMVDVYDPEAVADTVRKARLKRLA